MRIPITDWLVPDKLTLLKGWARDGLTDKEIIQRIGISRATFDRWKQYAVTQDGHEVKPIAEALKDGKEVIDYEVENALLKEALSGNTTAQIFWLKNRRPDKWRERRSEPVQPEPVQSEPRRHPLGDVLAQLAQIGDE